MKLVKRLKEDYFSIYHAINEAEVRKLLHGQLKTAAWLVAIIALLELIMFFVAQRFGFLKTDFASYVGHYIAVPTGINLAALLMAFIIRYKAKNLKLQVGANCIMYVVFCFVAYTVHLQFSSVALVFAIPILMTIVYGDFMLTTVVAVVSAVAKIISDVFLAWDPTYGLRLRDPIDVANFAVSLFVLSVVYAISLQLIRAERAKHRNALNQHMESLRLYQESITDSVTRIGNRSGLRAQYAQLAEEMKAGVQYTFLMIDMDNFKDVNDKHGHLTGDSFLKQFAMLIDEIPNSKAYRYGGDEFCLLLRGQDEAAVRKCCEKIQQDFQNCAICKEVEQVTVSFGAAICKSGLSLSELVWRADKALYQAKEKRGCVEYYCEEH